MIGSPRPSSSGPPARTMSSPARSPATCKPRLRPTRSAVGRSRTTAAGQGSLAAKVGGNYQGDLAQGVDANGRPGMRGPPNSRDNGNLLAVPNHRRPRPATFDQRRAWRRRLRHHVDVDVQIHRLLPSGLHAHLGDGRTQRRPWAHHTEHGLYETNVEGRAHQDCRERASCPRRRGQRCRCVKSRPRRASRRRSGRWRRRTGRWRRTPPPRPAAAAAASAALSASAEAGSGAVSPVRRSSGVDSRERSGVDPLERPGADGGADGGAAGGIASSPGPILRRRRRGAAVGVDERRAADGSRHALGGGRGERRPQEDLAV